MKVEIPLRTVSTANSREHWAVKAKRTKSEREAAYYATPTGLRVPLRVKLTRMGPRKLDTDNLAISLKGVRDGIADKCNIDDGCDLIKFEYAQEKSKQYGVRMEFMPWVS